MRDTLSSWESYARSVLRIILAFTFSLHGFRHLFGAFRISGGRRAAVPMALDGLPGMFGGLELVAGLLLMLGLLTRPVAAILCLELLAGYFYSAVPHGVWPIRNGGNEVLLYLLAFVYFAVAGGGVWSVDEMIAGRKSAPEISSVSAVRT